MDSAWLENLYPSEPLQPPPQLPQITSFDDALELLETTKLSLAMESQDALELWALQQQVLIGDYYAFDESEIARYATLLENAQSQAWKKRRGMKPEVASRRFVRLCQEILAFEYIQNDVNNLLFPDLRDSEQLELNALFQQANVGDNKPWSPKYFPTVSKEVWSAWSKKSGMSQRDARGYIQFTDAFMQRARDLADRYELKIESLAHIKPSADRQAFVHKHYHYYVPTEELPPQNYEYQ